MVGTGIAVLIGGLLEVIAIVPILADFFEGLISMLSDLFSNFEFLGSWVLSLLQPLIDVFQKLVELFYNLAEFIQNTFPNANERLVNIMISELAAIGLLHGWYGIEKSVESWKGSIGYNIFQVLDTPFRLVRESLDSTILKFLFNIVTLPMQTTLFIICLMIDFIENLF